jgi:hypothetical protein
MYGTTKTITGELLPPAGESRVAFVKRWIKRVQHGKRHWRSDFKRMREDMDFAYGLQWEGQTSVEIEDRYVANIVQRHINQRTSALYAKNPKVTAERRPRMDFTIWDGTVAPIQNMMAMASTGQPPTPEIAMLAKDVSEGMQLRNLLKKVATTLEILWTYYTDEQIPPFKLMMKDTVRSTLVTGVGYIELDFQRTEGHSEEKLATLSDARAQLDQLEVLAAEAQRNTDEGGYNENSAEMEQLKIQIQTIQNNPDLMLREGLIYDFPDTLSIIPSPSTKMLRGWYGTDWVCKEMIVPCSRVKEWFGIDLGTQYTEYKDGDDNQQPTPTNADADPDDKLVCLWKVYAKRDGVIYWMVEGHDDFLREPEKPSVDIERFFPFYVLTFNEVTHPTKVFPLSDVRLLRSMQKEYNRKKEALRQHRIANRPVYVTPAGTLTDEDLSKLVCDYPDHAIIPLSGLKEGQNAESALQPMKKAPIDPNLYETDTDFNDVLRVVGSQEANIGGTSGDTATEVSIAEGSRLSSVSSNEDDLEQTLSEMARDGGNVMLMNLSEETVKEIVGVGAAWPVLKPETIKKEMFLTVEAGTAGRPNKASELANFERIGPMLVQIPGIRPDSLAKHALRIMDDKIDLADFIGEGLPSILAMNAAGPLPGQPGAPPQSEDPAQQGAQGGDNAAKPPEGSGAGQPAYPPPGDSTTVADGDVS